MKRKTKNERAKVVKEEIPKDQTPNDNVGEEVLNDQSSMLNEEQKPSASVNSEELPVNSEQLNDEEVKSDTEIVEEDLAAMNEREPIDEEEEMLNAQSSIINDAGKKEPEDNKACNPDNFTDGGEITCKDYNTETDTHIWAFGFTTEIKGVKKKCTGICAAPDNEKTAWLKVVKTMSEMYPTLVFTYNQNLQKKKIGE